MRIDQFDLFVFVDCIKLSGLVSASQLRFVSSVLAGQAEVGVLASLTLGVVLVSVVKGVIQLVNC